MKPVLTMLAMAVSAGVGWMVYQNSLESTQQEKVEKPAQVAAVHVIHMESRPIEERVDLVGSLQANAAVEIRTAVAGYVRSMPFDIQDRVDKGALIVELDDSKYREMVLGAEAALKVAQAQLRAKQASAAEAQAEVERQAELERSRVATPQQMQAAKAQLEIAQAEVDLEQARVDQAKSELLRNKLESEETRIESPMAGFVAARYAEVGDLAGTNVPLLRIVDIGVVKTVVHVIEKDYQKVQVDQPASIEVDAFPGRTFNGKVVRKAPVLDPDTRTAAVHVEIPNSESLLKPGMHARVAIVFDRREQAPVVPIAALIPTEDQPAVYVVTGDPPTAEVRHIETGIYDGELVEILSGLEPDDSVITLGNRMIKLEQPLVTIEDPTWTPIAVNSTDDESEAPANTGD